MYPKISNSNPLRTRLHPASKDVLKRYFLVYEREKRLYLCTTGDFQKSKKRLRKQWEKGHRVFLFTQMPYEVESWEINSSIYCKGLNKNAWDEDSMLVNCYAYRTYLFAVTPYSDLPKFSKGNTIVTLHFKRPS